jgi:electron transport complex protein RnfG
MLVNHMLKTALMLGLFALAGTTLVALTYSTTDERIAENERQAIMRTLNALVPATQHDNDMLNDTVQVTAPDLLGSDKPVTVYRARQNGQPVAAVFNVVAPDGYNGHIKLLVAIHYDGIVAGVRVISHRETPGLGDSIEIEKSNWILGFDGFSIFNPPRQGWQVRKDGGEFDQFTGATITPRAVVKAVYKCLQYFNANREQVFAHNEQQAAS